MATGIATLVCYAGVFNDVIGVEEIATRLGASGRDDFFSALKELQQHGKIVMRDGFVALPHLGDKIAVKPSKIEKSRQLISSRMTDLEKLGRNPLIKFIGISGSLAAGNPTLDRKNHLDLDVFLITRNQCLWLYAIPLIIRSNFSRTKVETELCKNFILDESSMEITNKNFYTATEARNLVPVSGTDAYRKFIQANTWIDHYYPGFSGNSRLPAATASRNLVNKSLYILFCALRSVKRRSLEPLKQLSFTIDPLSGINFNRLCTHYGGYQGLVHRNFTRLAGMWFPDLLDFALIGKLFPDQLSVDIRKGNIDVFKLNAAAGLAYDYSKYG
jgi:hypothetical protein